MKRFAAARLVDTSGASHGPSVVEVVGEGVLRWYRRVDELPATVWLRGIIRLGACPAEVVGGPLVCQAHVLLPSGRLLRLQEVPEPVPLLSNVEQKKCNR